MLCSWVDNWFDDDINFQRNWVRQHASDGGFLGKPVRFQSWQSSLWVTIPNAPQKMLAYCCIPCRAVQCSI